MRIFDRKMDFYLTTSDNFSMFSDPWIAVLHQKCTSKGLPLILDESSSLKTSVTDLSLR